jgi:hypothetical protein
MLIRLSIMIQLRPFFLQSLLVILIINSLTVIIHFHFFNLIKLLLSFKLHTLKTLFFFQNFTHFFLDLQYFQFYPILFFLHLLNTIFFLFIRFNLIFSSFLTINLIYFFLQFITQRVQLLSLFIYYGAILQKLRFQQFIFITLDLQQSTFLIS